MPSSARWRCAVSEDDEVVEAMLNAGVDRPARPASGEWTLLHELVALAVDRLGGVSAAVIASAGGKPNQVPPYPRPLSAVDRVESKRAWQRATALIEEVRAAQAKGVGHGK